MISMRPYQDKGIRDGLGLINEGIRSFIYYAPCGAGKTVVCAETIRLLLKNRGKVLVLAHRIELIDQAVNKLVDAGLTDYGVIQGNHPETDYRKQIQVASVQTMIARMGPPAEVPLKFDLVVIDECHHALSESYVRIIEAIRALNPDVLLIGLTATPYRTDGRGLGEIYEKIVQISTTKELIELGYLVRPRVFCGPKIDMRYVKRNRSEYDMKSLGNTMNRPRLVGDAVKNWRMNAEGRMTVVFACDIPHSMAVCREFNDNGIKAVHIDYEMGKTERKDILARHEQREFDVLTNVNLLSEGWDQREVSCGLLMRPTQSRGLWRQQIGRTLRTFPGKPDAIVLDHAGNTHKHGLVTDPDRITLEGGLQAEGDPMGPREAGEVRVMCLNLDCGAFFDQSDALRNEKLEVLCPECGSPVPVPEITIDRNVTLTELASDVMAGIMPVPSREERQEFYKADAERSYVRGSRAGESARRFKDTFGCWPTNDDMSKSVTHEKWRFKNNKREAYWADWLGKPLATKKPPPVRTRVVRKSVRRFI